MRIHMFAASLITAALVSLGSATTVLVKAGDTLSSLAARNGTTVTALLQANPGIRPNSLQVGQMLTLPTRAASKAGVTVRAASVRVSAVQPVQGRLTTPFNARHGGVDLAAPAGTPIRATMAGTVKTSVFDARNGWGWTVVVEHANGLSTRYSHNSMNLVRTGQRVATGQVIARVGSTGNSTGPHLDYRVYQAGVPVNPNRLF
jgi:murein DD-endopeptidase MepM/ murein hydrolase activator NlpD